MALFSTRGLLWFAVALPAILLVVGAVVTIGSIGRIDELEEASRELDDRDLRFTSRFRSQVFRLQSLALRSQLRLDERFRAEFDAQRLDSERFLEERQGLFSSDDEQARFSLLRERLSLFCLQLDEMMESSVARPGESPQDRLAAIRDAFAASSEDLSLLGEDKTVSDTRLRLQQAFSAAVIALLDRREVIQESFRGTVREAREALELLVASLAAAGPAEIAPEVFAGRLKAASGKGTRFLALAEETITSASSSPAVDPRDQLERFEALSETRDSMVELATQLGDSRREAFRSRLGQYHSSAESLRSRLLASLLLLLAAMLVGVYFAYRAFIVPMRGRLDTAEESVRYHGNLVTMGTLASGIAHEIRNPLTAIKARLFALQELVEKSSPAGSQASVIGIEIERLERIVQEFLDYARPREPNLAPTDLQAFLEDLRDLLLPDLQARGIEFSLGEPIGLRIRIDREQIQQIVLNLVRNAADACTGEGRKISLSATERAEGGVRFTVADNGSGIPAEFRARVFEPFFSKKKGGSGLGLPICRSIARAHRGDLNFDTVEGEGTSFHLDLP